VIIWRVTESHISHAWNRSQYLASYFGLYA
jgi:hypothetical protein